VEETAGSRHRGESPRNVTGGRGFLAQLELRPGGKWPTPLTKGRSNRHETVRALHVRARYSGVFRQIRGRVVARLLAKLGTRIGPVRFLFYL
jgi:hypothetical protein